MTSWTKLLPAFKGTSFIFLILVSQINYAQDLNCDVVVNAQQIQSQDRRVFQDMELAFENFLNSREWSSDEFKPEERIKCSLTVNLVKMPSIGNFQATVQIRSSRPVYHTKYESILFNFADRDWDFEYVESMPLIFNENDFTNNLTSMLAFYAYIVIGLDYDSFGELAGTPYFQKAQIIVNNAAQSNLPGWSGLESTRNRFSLLDDIMNPQMVELRKGYYKYHRLGLDVFDDNPNEARKQVMEVLTSLQKVKARYPSSIFVISIFDAKSEELANIFSDAPLQEKRNAYNMLVELNPNKTDMFSKLLK